MHIGVDFDNTIVCYDALFHRVAREQNLIPADVPVDKCDVRDHLQRIGKGDVWTELQGHVYGARMAEAAPYPGVIDFFLACRQAGIRISIISHKTRYPFFGERHDLLQAAVQWLELNGFFDPAKIGLPRDCAFFEPTREAKIERIVQQGCTHFVDDLPEVLGAPTFPDIGRILFDPNDRHAAGTQFIRARSWPGIWEKTGAMEGMLKFAAQHGFDGKSELAPIAGGGNNRVYHVRAPGRDAVLKQYFRHPADPRDRFGAEHAFYDYLWSRDIRRTPEPLGWDAVQRLGLFSLVQGRKIRSEEINANAIDQALEFILELNRDRRGAESVPPASESCFSDADHLESIGRRVARLEKIDTSSETKREAADFINRELQPAWREIARRCAGMNQTLPREQWVLSPSDFGFHNALLPADGRFRFFDFEYAGWDDPAKLICDFFCSPQIPVALEFWDHFVGTLVDGLKLDPVLRERARLLLPACQLKWCCIILNEFARTDRERRDFAKGAATAHERETAQLAKARRLLQNIRPLRD